MLCMIAQLLCEELERRPESLSAPAGGAKLLSANDNVKPTPSKRRYPLAAADANNCSGGRAARMSKLNTYLELISLLGRSLPGFRGQRPGSSHFSIRVYELCLRWVALADRNNPNAVVTVRQYRRA